MPSWLIPAVTLGLSGGVICTFIAVACCVAAGRADRMRDAAAARVQRRDDPSSDETGAGS